MTYAIMENYPLIKTGSLPSGSTYYHPEMPNALVHLDSPAVEVFTDFKSKPPEIITADQLVSKALDTMKMTRVKSLLVIDELDKVIGMVSARGLQGVRVGKIAAENDVLQKDVTVEMAMVPCANVITLDVKQIDNSKAGHIVRIMHETGANYILVTEAHPEHDEQTIVRGLFSASRISRQTGEQVVGDLSSHSLADLNKRIP